ncbi:50S ribosomal protein L9 [Pectinatus brassicae]|uniref:Large ribosomal subunit protein bL9 n=1 Tax=Pectinatus brassicae TaxID=862415 RepID=A0A840UWE5_9FIRM|nr:50S ribosomal protein L9 [Pectinatus brassicae]MBB5337203.1 large subunit ribosomal protein L9 [Pectinatus brassicae]
MKVILEQDLKKVGKKGDIVEVSEGYARNFLFPKNIAIEATASNVNVAKAKQGSQQRKKQQANDEAILMAAQLEKVEITLVVRVGEAGKLFGSITGKDISAALKKDFNIDIDKRKIELTNEIKSIGDYEAVIKVHPTITAKITLHVIAN